MLRKIYLISCENNGDVLADPDKIPVPVGDIFVGDARGDIEHDDGALALHNSHTSIVRACKRYASFPTKLLCVQISAVNKTSLMTGDE